MHKPTLNDCTLIRLPRFTDERGALTFLEGRNHIPFEIKRVFYMYDLQVGQVRGAHAHKVLHQLLISVSGSFDVTLDDGSEKRVVRLDKPWEALHIPPMIWASESNFSSGAVCLVMASDVYTESEYIRDYEQYLRFIELG